MENNSERKMYSEFPYALIIQGDKMEKLDIIEGKQVRLRRILIEDTRLIVEWRNNPRVSQMFVFREKFTTEMHLHWMETKVASGQVIQYIIEEKVSGKPIGSVYFSDVNHIYRSAEYGIFIGENEAVGKGYGSETAKLFIDYAFKKLNFHRISLRVLEENQIAYKSYISAGFKKEGVFRDMVFLDGEYKNVVFMAIIESD